MYTECLQFARIQCMCVSRQEEIIAKRLGKNGFGFGQMSENRQVATDGLLRQVEPEDLALRGDDRPRILQTPTNSLLKQFRKLVKIYGADLTVTEAVIE